MTEVLVERFTADPLSEAELARMGAEASGCLALHRVHWNRSLLSLDGRDLICHFSGADVESVRFGVKKQGPIPAQFWSCTLRDAPGITNDDVARANVLASWRLERPAMLDELHAQSDAGDMCQQTHRARFVRMLVSDDARRIFSLYVAPDAESVRIALRDAKAPVERVWAFRQFHP